MKTLIIIGCVIGWLAIGILVNWFLDYVCEVMDKENAVLSDDLDVFLAVIAWPVVLLFMAVLGLAGLVILLVSLRPGRRREHSD